MSVIARRIAICQHPNGEGVWWDVHDEAEPTCVQDCDCKPVVYVLEAQQPQGAVEALRFYANPATWDTISPHGTVTTNTIAKRDNGDRARRALGGQ